MDYMLFQVVVLFLAVVLFPVEPIHLYLTLVVGVGKVELVLVVQWALALDLTVLVLVLPNWFVQESVALVHNS